MKETEMLVGSVKEEKGDVSVVSLIKKLITQGVNEINDIDSLQELYKLVNILSRK